MGGELPALLAMPHQKAKIVAWREVSVDGIARSNGFCRNTKGSVSKSRYDEDHYATSE